MSAFPALAGLLVPAGEEAGGPDSFPPEIEEDANNYFQVCGGGRCAFGRCPALSSCRLVKSRKAS